MDTCFLADLAITDEKSFRHVGLYADLKKVLERDRYPFRILPEESRGRWDRAVLMNLTFWNANDAGDVLVDKTIAADVVAHVAWHHLARRALPLRNTRPSSRALFLGESIASAFDLYLVGRLIGHSPQSDFLQTQVPSMADAAMEAGLSEDEFSALLESVTADPETAFEQLRQLLFDATLALTTCRSADEAFVTLARFDKHRFAALLHHYELSNWVLYARACASPEEDPEVSALDRTLRNEAIALDWLEANWVSDSLRSTRVE